MILSHRHGFIFVRARKVAGTSVEMALSTLCGGTDIVNPMIPVDERLRQGMKGFCGNYSDNPAFEKAYIQCVLNAAPEALARLPMPPANYHAHMSVRAIARRYPGSIAGFRVICVERDPYAKVISALAMHQGFANYARLGEMRGATEKMAHMFDEMEAQGGLEHLRSLDLYRDESGAIVAETLRYERLTEDLDAFVRSLGVTHPITLPHAKRGPMSNAIDPTSVLRRDQIDTVNRLFAEEFERFGYRRI
jgi:hypothetical protein